MMPDVRVSPSMFKRLQALAEPLVDSPEAVIGRLLDHYEASRGPAPARSAAMAAAVAARFVEVPPELFDAFNPPDLTHTKLLSAEAGGREATDWNDLVDAVHREAMARLKSFDKLRAATRSQIARGKRSDRGYHYLADIDVSIQGIDADYAWRNALSLARHVNLSIRVDFEWRRRPGAAHPGKRGRFEWKPAAR